jgi:hypothetical protein
MEASTLANYSEILKDTASVLKQCGYLSTQSLPSLKRPLWKLIFELHALPFIPQRAGNCFSASAVPEFYAGRFLRGRSLLKTAYSMFFLNRPVFRSSGEKLLGKTLLSNLLLSGTVKEIGDHVQSSVRFVPWLNYIILSDPDEGSERNTNFYIYVGGDSTFLIDFVNKHMKSDIKAERVLDLCAGTSIQSYNLLNICSNITAAELNPRAIEYAKVTRLINGVQCINIIQSDLWDSINGTFDVIICNPPYLPIPQGNVSGKTLDAFGGGELGMEIPLRIVDGLGEHLSPEGYSAVLAASPIIKGKDTLVENLLPIAEKHGLSIRVFAWKYTNLKRDMKLQIEWKISHFVYYVIEAQKTGISSVLAIHQPFYKRLPQLLLSRIELILSH